MNALSGKPEAFQLFIRTLSQSQPMTLVKLNPLNSIFRVLTYNCISYIHEVLINLKFFSSSINPNCLAPPICHLDFLYPLKHLLSDTLDSHYIIANVDLFQLFRYIIKYLYVLSYIGIRVLHSTDP